MTILFVSGFPARWEGTGRKVIELNYFSHFMIVVERYTIFGGSFNLTDAPFLEGRSAIALVVCRGGAYNITHRVCDPNGCSQE